jgi:hypothetical protein
MGSQARERNMVATVVRFGVRVIDGECIPVPGLKLGARYKYENNPSTWDSADTNGDGTAHFSDEHAEPPLQVDIYIEDSFCDTFPVEDGATYVLEV